MPLSLRLFTALLLLLDWSPDAGEKREIHNLTIEMLDEKTYERARIGV